MASTTDKHATYPPGMDRALPSASLPSPPPTPRSSSPNADLAVSRPQSPAATSETLQMSIAHSMVGETKREKWDRRLKEFGCHFSLFIAGWSDASSGPLIPYIQEHYKISYTVVSMLFVGQMVGFLLAAGVCSWLNTKFGLGKTIVLGAVLQATAYVFLIPAFPFPAFPVIYAFGGFGLALQDAMANTYIAALPVGADKKLSYLHASYGLGAAVCPLAATGFVSSGILFSRFYATSLGIAALNVLLLLYAFKFSYRCATDEVPDKAEANERIASHLDTDMELSDRRTSTAAASYAEKGTDAEQGRVDVPTLDTSLPASNPKKKSESLLWATLKQRTTIFVSIFVFLYVGAEVSMGGWIVTFIIENRAGGVSAGYVASGYWFGLMGGRLIFSKLNIVIGEKRALYIYTTIALALEFSIWFARNLVGNAVVVAIVGLLMGPSYPVAISVTTKLLPRKYHTSAISFIAAFGQTGSAIFPFITGALAQKFSPVALQPVMIVLLATQLIAWFCVPSLNKKSQ